LESLFSKKSSFFGNLRNFSGPCRRGSYSFNSLSLSLPHLSTSRFSGVGPFGFWKNQEKMENIDDVETVKKILRFFRSKRNLTSKEVDHEVAEMRISRYVFFFWNRRDRRSRKRAYICFSTGSTRKCTI